LLHFPRHYRPQLRKVYYPLMVLPLMLFLSFTRPGPSLSYSALGLCATLRVLSCPIRLLQASPLSWRPLAPGFPSRQQVPFFFGVDEEFFCFLIQRPFFNFHSSFPITFPPYVLLAFQDFSPQTGRFFCEAHYFPFPLRLSTIPIFQSGFPRARDLKSTLITSVYGPGFQ